ncbi:MAG: hypothetical protein U0S36_00915 [Candidatus Nanopelagicales bacterium]|jgi:hypothetical protein
MAELSWTENSQTMFEEGLKVTPAPFRRIGRTNLLKGLTSIVGEGGEVHEDDVVRAIREFTPKPFVAMGLTAVEPHRTAR